MRAFAARGFHKQRKVYARRIRCTADRGAHRIVADWRKEDLRDRPGAGAAGGLGFGLMAFCGAEVHRGFDQVAELPRLAEAIAESDFIIAGEGSLDAQTLEGKAPAGVAELARRFGKPCIAFAGRVDPASLPILLCGRLGNFKISLRAR